MKKIIQRPDGSVKVVTENTKPSRTQQHFKDHTDINKIMKKYHNDMRLINPPQRGFYGDFSNAPDYLDARMSLINAQKAFDGLSSEIRKRFGNDPLQLLAFLDDKKNKDEAIRLGLIDPPPPPPEPPAPPPPKT